MLNVFALRPASKKLLESKASKLPTPLVRHHVLKDSARENSGRLFCEDEVDVEVPQCDIYAAR